MVMDDGRFDRAILAPYHNAAARAGVPIIGTEGATDPALCRALVGPVVARRGGA